MNKILMIVFGLFVMTSCCKKRNPQSDTKEIIEEVREEDYFETEDYDIVLNNSLFAFELYRQIDKGDKNVFFSPFSISSALAMTYAGAKGTTEIQMSKVLLFSRDHKQVHSGFNQIMKEMNSNDNVELRIANSLWASQNLIFQHSYMETCKKYYGSEVFYADFKNKTEKSRKEINLWVENNTENKIKNLIKEGMLNKSTRFVLVNAIYFNAAWQIPFIENYSHNGVFNLNNGGMVQARFMMHQNEDLNYFEDKNLQLLELPYKNHQYSMILILPAPMKSVQEIEELLTYNAFTRYLEQANEHPVKVFLPKFSFTYDMELSENLKEMGMTDAFSDEADFSEMTGKKDLKIDKVIHKAFVDVNEVGTEAAAATAVIMVESTGLMEDILVFKADRPFIFLIKNNETGSILFMGRVMNPVM